MKPNQSISKKIRILSVVTLMTLFIIITYDILVKGPGVKRSFKLMQQKQQQIGYLKKIKANNLNFIEIINELHHYGDAYEGHVRYDTGLIKKNEHYYKLVGSKH